MSAAYEIAQIAKKENSLISDYELCKKLHISMQKLNNWKKNASQPNGLTYLKLIKESGLSLDDAIDMIENAQRSESRKEAGFGDITFLSNLALISLGAVSLSKLTHIPYEAIGAWMLSSGTVYIMLNGKLVKVSKIKGKLQRLSDKQLSKLVAANDIEIRQVSTHSIY